MRLSERTISLLYAIFFTGQAAIWLWHGYARHKEELFRRLYEHVQSLSERDIDVSMDVSSFVAGTNSWIDMCLSKWSGVVHGLSLAVIVASAMFALAFGD